MAFDLIEPDVIIHYIRMETNFEVDIFIGSYVALLGLDTEELFAEGQIPVEVSTYVA